MLEADARFLDSLSRTNPTRARFLQTSLENSSVAGAQIRRIHEELEARSQNPDKRLADAFEAVHTALPQAMHPDIREKLFFADLTEKEN